MKLAAPPVTILPELRGYTGARKPFWLNLNANLSVQKEISAVVRA